ncbi:glycosyltransferase family 4 protein [Spirosoma koreense]
MKKLLVSAYACIPNQGSEQATGWAYATMLSQNDLDVHCLTLIDGQEVIDAVLAGGGFPNLTVHYVTLPEWVNAFYHKGLIGMYFHYLFWQWQAYQTARRLHRVMQFDLVHHVTWGSIQLGSFMYKLGIPFVFGPVGGGQRAPKSLKRYFGRYWSREVMRDGVSTLLEHLNPGYYKAVRLADKLIVANKDTGTLARRLRPHRPIERMGDSGLYPSFVPQEPIHRQADATGPLKLLWVGRLLPRKALELIIQALGQVNPELPITLTIVGGKGEMADQVPHYIERYGVGNRINWIGHVSFEEVKAYYRQSDVFFFTSLRDTGPHQLLEAMAYSLPIVTVNLHGQAEMVNNTNGFKIPVTTEEQVVTGLARAIEWMYAHPEERMAMGQAGYAFARTQLWEAKVQTFIHEMYAPLWPHQPAAGQPVMLPTDVKTNY